MKFLYNKRKEIKPTEESTESNNKKKSIIIPTPWGPFKIPSLFRKNSVKTIYEIKTKNEILEEFYKNLIVEFPFTHPGVPIIFVIDQIKDLNQLQNFLKTILPHNNFIRVIASISLFNYNQCLFDLKPREIIEIHKSFTPIHCPCIFSQDQIQLYLEEKFSIIEIPEKVIRGITFLKSKEFKNLQNIEYDDSWIISEHKISIPPDSLHKYFYAEKYQLILDQSEKVLQGLQIYSWFFNEQIWPYEKMVLKTLLEGIYHMKGLFSFHRFQALLEVNKDQFKIDESDQKDLYNRLSALLQKYNIAEVISKELL